MSVQAGNTAAFSDQRRLRLAYFVSHPIQYQAPFLRRLAQETDIDLTVFFSSDHSVRGYVDPGFGVKVEWDVPLLEGYKSEFLPIVREAREGEFFGAAGNINRGVRHKIREGNFDAVWVHGYQYLTNLRAIQACHALHIPVLLRAESTLHDRPRSKLKLALKEQFFRWLKPRIAAVLPIGKENSEYWTHTLGGVPQFPVHYCVDNGFFQQRCALASQTRHEFRASLGLDADRPVILFAAKLSARKRCPDLLEAYIALAKSDKLRPRPYLLIVGDGEQRGMLDSRVKQATSAEIIRDDDVRLLGFQNQSELPRFYDLCDVFVLASVDEPWGLAVNEVMNAARPVIVTSQVGCQRDLVQDDLQGCVIEAGDTDALARSLERVLSDLKRARAMGTESLRTINAYNFERNVAELRRAFHGTVPGFPVQ